MAGTRLARNAAAAVVAGIAASVAVLAIAVSARGV